MRKWIYNLFFIVTSLLVVQSLIAQSNGNGISIVGALTESRINGRSSNWSGSLILGGQAGVIFPVANFNESISLKVEINGSIQGTKWKEELVIYNPNGVPVNTANREGKLTFLYMNVPLIVRYKTKSRLFFEAGIQAGYLIDMNNIYYNAVTGYHNLPFFKSEFKSFDFGIPVGVGYEFKNNIGVGLRLIQGLSNITDYLGTNFVVALRGSFTFKKK